MPRSNLIDVIVSYSYLYHQVKLTKIGLSKEEIRIDFKDLPEVIVALQDIQRLVEEQEAKDEKRAGAGYNQNEENS